MSLVSACSREKDRLEKVDRDAQEQARDAILNQIKSDYPGINELNARDKFLTFSIQDKIRKSPRFILRGYYVYDISHDDSLWTLSLSDYSRRNMVDLTCNSPIAIEALSMLGIDTTSMQKSSRFYGRSLFFITQLKSVQRIRMYLGTAIEGSGEDAYSYVRLDSDLPLHLRGELVEVR